LMAWLKWPRRGVACQGGWAVRQPRPRRLGRWRPVVGSCRLGRGIPGPSGRTWWDAV